MKKGSKMTEEQRTQVSDAQKRRFANPEERKKIGESSKGRIPWNKGTKGLVKSWNKGKRGLQVAWNKGKTGIYSEETRRKMGSASKGRKLSEDHKRKIRENARINPNFGMSGKHHSEETLSKLSESHKGQIPTNLEQLRKLSVGHKVSEETRKRISISNRGRKRSKESIEKNRLAHLGKPAWNKGKQMPEISGARHPMFGKTHSEKSKLKMSESHKRQMANPEFRKRLSEVHKKRLSDPEERKRQSEISTATLLRLYESGKFPRQENTKPERDIKAELIKRGYKEEIEFIHQYRFMNKFMCDFCFPKQKVIVEVYGDFWHCNPEKYPVPIHKHQIKGMGRDKSKEAYITKVDNRAWTYLVLWESDIKKAVAKSVDKIEEILKNKLTPLTGNRLIG